MKFPLALAVLAAAFSTAAVAQPATDRTGPATKNEPPGKSAGESSRYLADDCRKDMENAREAQQAGHITEKEYAEQKKMARTKMDRDAGRAAGRAGGDAACG